MNCEGFFLNFTKVMKFRKAKIILIKLNGSEKNKEIYTKSCYIHLATTLAVEQVYLIITVMQISNQPFTSAATQNI